MLVQGDKPRLWINPTWQRNTPGTFAVVIGGEHLRSSGRRSRADPGHLRPGPVFISALTAYRFFHWLCDRYQCGPRPLVQVLAPPCPHSGRPQDRARASAGAAPDPLQRRRRLGSVRDAQGQAGSAVPRGAPVLRRGYGCNRPVHRRSEGITRTYVGRVFRPLCGCPREFCTRCGPHKRTNRSTARQLTRALRSSPTGPNRSR